MNDVKIRALKDLGCQCNFITDKIADSQHLKVVNNKVDLRVNGFNGSKDYKTRMVEVPLRTESGIHNIIAVCIPEIKININLPRLNEIARAFILRGYSLADPFLLDGSNMIRDLQFILGTRSAYCMKSTEKSFGLESQSIYADCPQGVMLMGMV